MDIANDNAPRRRAAAPHAAPTMDAATGGANGGAEELNDLLTVINGYSELLLGRLDQGDPNRKLVDEMRRAGARAAALTRLLLPSSDSEVAAPRVLDVNTLVRDLEKLLRHTIGPTVELATALYANQPVSADAGQLDQVLLNLALNAREAMPRGGRLTIETRDVEVHSGAAPGGYVLVAMSDTGAGMTPEVRARLFEPFFTTKEAANATGLGLATVDTIVRRAGGHVEVESEPGRGATFKLYLPWARHATQQGATMTAIPTFAHGHEIVLLVEDEPAVRSLVRLLLESHGYRVLQAQSGTEALELCKQQGERIDLLITDLVMPVMGGQQLAAAMQAEYPDVRVLFLSGYTDDAIERHGPLPQKIHFMQKPFVASDLMRLVREVLDAPKQ